MGATTTFVHFTVDGDRLAVSLEEIREVARVTQITPVPRSPSIIRGLANIRGRVVTLLDADVIYARSARGAGAARSAAPGGDGGHAVVFSGPRDHLALFTRSRVDLGRGEEASVGGEPAGGSPPDPGAPPMGPLLTFGEDVVRLLPAAGIAAHCGARILERYRRRG